MEDRQFTPEFHVRELRKSGRFVFAYFLEPGEKTLPQGELKAKLKIHFDKCLQSFFDGQPKRKDYSHEVERY